MEYDIMYVSPDTYSSSKARYDSVTSRCAAVEREYYDACAQWDRMEQEAQRIAEESERLGVEKITEQSRQVLSEVRRARDDVQRILSRQSADNEEKIRQIRQTVAGVKAEADRLNSKIDDLSAETMRRFRELADQELEKGNRARMYVNRFESLLTDILGLNPYKLTPGAVEPLETTCDFLKNDLSAGDFEEAISLAQTRLPEAMTLRTRLEQLNARFRSLREQLGEGIKKTRQHLEALRDSNSNRQEISVEQARYQYDGRIDFWSNQWYSRLENDIERICHEAREAEDAMVLSDMEQAIQWLHQTDGLLTDCDSLARHEFLLSAMIRNRATEIAQVMTMDESWLLLPGAGFVQDDERRSYQLFFNNGNGKTASFVVIPDREITPRKQPGNIRFAVNVCDGEHIIDSADCSNVREAVMERLEYGGIPVGEADNRTVSASPKDDSVFLSEMIGLGDRQKQQRMEAAFDQARA